MFSDKQKLRGFGACSGVNKVPWLPAPKIKKKTERERELVLMELPWKKY